jgi:glycosyltransferase involved in cell wall biosynthesis
VTVIPNALDINRYKPIQKSLAREILGLPIKEKLILFGAVKGTQLSYKGWDLLQPALAKLSVLLPDVQAVIFGQGAPKNPPSLGMPLHWMGHLHDDATLALLYSAADVVVVPSRQENLPQLGTEAHSCGCPVVAFNATGLRDVVEHGKTGYLAEPYSSEDLATGIEWVLADDDRHALLSINARNRAVQFWSHATVVPKYLEVYQRAISARACQL